MIASFFQHLEANGVEYLLISGQATILYGAASFSEDVDLWVKPVDANFSGLIAALQASCARYYKLTPPLTAENAQRGHGFHFVLPDAPNEAYLDIMGAPPRVGTFAEAVARARYFETDSGRIHTVGIPDLVELKKTQRPEDYPIIARLVSVHLRGITDVSSDTIRWAFENCLNLREMLHLLGSYRDSIAALTPPPPAFVVRAMTELSTDGTCSARTEDQVDDWLQGRITDLRRADRRYWSTIIEELKRFRQRHELMPEGTAV